MKYYFIKKNIFNAFRWTKVKRKNFFKKISYTALYARLTISISTITRDRGDHVMVSNVIKTVSVTYEMYADPFPSGEM